MREEGDEVRKRPERVLVAAVRESRNKAVGGRGEGEVLLQLTSSWGGPRRQWEMGPLLLSQSRGKVQ